MAPKRSPFAAYTYRPVSVTVEDGPAAAGAPTQPQLLQLRGIALEVGDAAPVGPNIKVLHEDGAPSVTCVMFAMHSPPPPLTPNISEAEPVLFIRRAWGHFLRPCQCDTGAELIRVWAATEVKSIDHNADSGARPLSKEYLESRKQERLFYRGSVAGRDQYYMNELEGQSIEVWSELDRAWVCGKVTACQLNFDKEEHKYHKGPAKAEVTYADGSTEAISDLFKEVWKLSGETAEGERLQQHHTTILDRPENGLWAARSDGSDLVHLAKQLEPGRKIVQAQMSRCMLVLRQEWEESNEDGQPQTRQLRALIELPVEADVPKAGGAVDVRLDDKGIAHVFYTALHGTLASDM
jgi:hypothetical protein